jgi:hypothetical protein
MIFHFSYKVIEKTDAEVTAAVQFVLKACDKDGDGKIATEEMVNAVRALKLYEEDPSWYDDLFKAVDGSQLVCDKVLECGSGEHYEHHIARVSTRARRP